MEDSDAILSEEEFEIEKEEIQFNDIYEEPNKISEEMADLRLCCCRKFEDHNETMKFKLKTRDGLSKEERHKLLFTPIFDK